MGVPPKKNVAVKVLLNGNAIKTITVNQHTLYTLLDLDKAQPGTLELQAASSGLSAYAFTFGSWAKQHKVGLAAGAQASGNAFNTGNNNPVIGLYHGVIRFILA